MGAPGDGHAYLDALSTDWIDDAQRQRAANASTVVVFETADQERIHQFLRLKRAETRDPGLWVYDRWRGLTADGCNADSLAQTTGITSQSAGLRRDLSSALQLVESTLTGTKPGGRAPDLVFTDLTELRLTSTDYALLDALRAWLRDDVAYLTDFTAYIFAPSAMVLDEHTRRQCIVIPVPISLPEERRTLVEHVAAAMEIRLKPERVETVVAVTGGLDLHGLRAALMESGVARGDFDTDFLGEVKSRLIRSSGLLELEQPQYGFERVGGYEQVRAFLFENLVDHWSEEGKALDQVHSIPPPRGILLFGPPGTGKTLLAKALAREVSLPFINFRSDNIYSSLLGESGQRFAQATKLIDALSPALVFIDEIDRFGKRASATDSAGEETRRVFSQMLEWLGSESRNCIVVGTTNRPADLDEAFLRPGRFDYKIPMGFPGASARADILRKHMGLGGPAPRLSTQMSDSELDKIIREELVPATELFTGAELEQFVLRVKRCARARRSRWVERSDLTEALGGFRLARARLEDERARFDKDVEQFADDVSLVEPA